MPWIEDKYLQYFSNGDNKTSYTAKQNMKTHVTGDKNVNAIQDGIADGVGGQLGSNGLLGGVGDAASKQGMNRVERGEHESALKDGQSQGKGWGETLTGGMMGGSSGKK